MIRFDCMHKRFYCNDIVSIIGTIRHIKPILHTIIGLNCYTHTQHITCTLRNYRFQPPRLRSGRSTWSRCRPYYSWIDRCIFRIGEYNMSTLIVCAMYCKCSSSHPQHLQLHNTHAWILTGTPFARVCSVPVCGAHSVARTLLLSSRNGIVGKFPAVRAV